MRVARLCGRRRGSPLQIYLRFLLIEDRRLRIKIREEPLSTRQARWRGFGQPPAARAQQPREARRHVLRQSVRLRLRLLLRYGLKARRRRGGFAERVLQKQVRRKAAAPERGHARREKRLRQEAWTPPRRASRRRHIPLFALVHLVCTLRRGGLGATRYHITQKVQRLLRHCTS